MRLVIKGYDKRFMSSQPPSNGRGPDGKATSSGSQAQRPGWADGLRQLYDSVVDEPLPDTFKDLLNRLDSDQADDGDARSETDGSDRGRG